MQLAVEGKGAVPVCLLRTRQSEASLSGKLLFDLRRYLEVMINNQDEYVIAFENIRLAGSHHWLIAPKEHIRDIENLDGSNLPLCREQPKLRPFC